MEEQKALSETDISRILSNPEGISPEDLPGLESLVRDFPYCQSFRFAYTSALKKYDREQFELQVQKSAAISPKREVLYKFIYQPEAFRKDRPLVTKSSPSFVEEKIAEAMPAEEDTAEMQNVVVVDQLPQTAELTDNITSATEEINIESEVPEEVPVSADESEPSSDEIGDAVEDEAPEPEIAPEVESIDTGAEETPSAVTSITNDIETVIPEGEHPYAEKETDGHPEIVLQETAEQPEPAEYTQPEQAAKDPEEEKLIVGSIAHSDYFVFDRSAVDPLKSDQVREIKPEAVAVKEEQPETGEVSKYHDDTLPYTFLWWLHKTRKEFAGTYQPYVKPPMAQRQPAGTVLNQQIIENIFHIQPELNTFPADTVTKQVDFEVKKKEDEIIEKFIKEDPQIRPPQIDRLDTENKARKSSEDSLDLVSETLAKIYTDQMLYHKAIDTYKKLSLKFPEKSTYFAGQIKELEKKIN